MTTDATTNTEVAELLAQLDEMYPLLQLEAEDSERLRRPTPAVQQALKDSGIFGLMVPPELGGFGTTPLQIIEVIEKLSHADASLGWLVRALTSETANAATYLNDAAVAELFADGRCPLVAGQSTSFSGDAMRENGGYRVSGTWQFAPGVSMATHLNVAVTVKGSNETLVCLVPRADLRITDNWDMLGLRATASLDYVAEDVFVEDKFVFGIGREDAKRGGVVNRLSPALLAGLQQGAWSQGVARRMLDELRVLTQHKSPSVGAPVTSDEFFAEFARHYSHVRGTMALLRETWRENETTLAAGDDLSDEQETMSRLASSLATRTALELSQLVHRFAGAQVMRNGVLQRFFRDSHAGTQHRGSAHIVTQQCGRMLSGTLPEGAHWGFFDLVIPDAATTNP
ncbi:acyl-CoA dehydrogenase family protein [Rhodococcus sp. T2V]|uniref:acyl-CoA dehydrogenase family protein n=1 Tax=Rhodococcus sp. T2V TaxID=3034164 RepID=UPI0023E15DD1|nr:acyl-CoA dehydrogenase family protein [Rhodococcus sp. T2V]MDF3306421.1 acyl-CoA dehydrogenase family protein [Rhodococcus sp. T2V]